MKQINVLKLYFLLIACVVQQHFSGLVLKTTTTTTKCRDMELRQRRVGMLEAPPAPRLHPSSLPPFLPLSPVVFSAATTDQTTPESTNYDTHATEDTLDSDASRYLSPNQTRLSTAGPAAMLPNKLELAV